MICTVCLRIIILVLRHTIIHETVLKEILCHCSFIYLFILPSRLRLPHCIIIMYNKLHMYIYVSMDWCITEFTFFKHNFKSINNDILYL